jgi:hypothetical protein
LLAANVSIAATAAAAADKPSAGLTLADTPRREVVAGAGVAAGVRGRLIGLWGCWQLEDAEGDPHSEEAADPPAL